MINLNTIAAGDSVRLNDGRIVLVVENMGDGQWLEVRAAEADAEQELVHSQDIAEHIVGKD